MSKLQRDDAKMLWEQMGEERDWKALIGVLEQHIEQSKGIEDSTVRALLCEARDFQKLDEEFPVSANKMLLRMNERIEDFRNSDCAEQLMKTAGEKKSSGQAVESEKRSEKSAKSLSYKDSDQKPSQRWIKQPDEKAGEQAQPSARQKARSEQPENWPGSGVEENWQDIQQGQDVAPVTPSAPQTETSSEAQREKRMIRLTTSDPEHLHTLYKRGNWKNWDDMIAWLRKRTEGQHSYSPEMVRAMIKDMKTLKAHGAKLNEEGEQTFKIRRGKVVK